MRKCEGRGRGSSAEETMPGSWQLTGSLALESPQCSVIEPKLWRAIIGLAARTLTSALFWNCALPSN